MRAVIALPLLLIAMHLLHLQLDRVPPPKPVRLDETLPSIEALRLLSLGYESLVADYYWLRTLNELGAREKHAVDYPNLEPLIRRTLALDPYFRTGYLLAGTALTMQGQDTRAAVELLEQGERYRPDLWIIPFYLGFNLYHFHGDYAGAARALARAAPLPGAPPIAGALATRLAATAGTPEVGLAMIDSLLPTLTEERLRTLYEERRKLLLLELQLKWLRQAAAHFRATHDRPPATLDELVGPGLLRSLPEEPLGGRFFLADGEVETTSEKQRLRLREPNSPRMGP